MRTPTERHAESLHLTPVTPADQLAALRVAHDLMQGWRETSPSSAAAHAFVERERGIPRTVWKDVLQCGVLPVAGSLQRDHARVLVNGLARTCGNDAQAAAHLLESAYQAGLLLRREAEIHAAGRQAHGPRWNTFSREEQRVRLEQIISSGAARGEAPTRFYSDYPVVITEAPAVAGTSRTRPGAPGNAPSSVTRRYGHWLAVPVMGQVHVDRAPEVVGFVYRSLRPVTETGKDFRHRTTRRNAFSATAMPLLGRANYAEAIAERKTVVLVEGTMDYLAASAAFHANPVQAFPPVAVQGIDLSEPELDALGTVAPVMVLALDQDRGGHVGTEQLGRRLAVQGVRTFVGAYPDGAASTCKDPSDVVRLHGVEALVALQQGAKHRPLPRFVLQQRLTVMTQSSGSPTRRQQLRAAEAVASVLTVWPGAVDRLSREASVALDLSAETVALAVREAKSQYAPLVESPSAVSSRRAAHQQGQGPTDAQRQTPQRSASDHQKEAERDRSGVVRPSRHTAVASGPRSR